jgi:hypothetical protein
LVVIFRCLLGSAGTETEQTASGLVDVIDGGDGLVLVADLPD